MALPDLSKMNALDLLRLADNPENQMRYFFAHRAHERIPLSANPTTAEYVWFTKLALTGYMLKGALEQLSPDDIISLWGEKFPEPRPRGPRPNIFYVVAWTFHTSRGLPLAVLFRDFVLPALIETGKIAADNKDQESAARVDFNKAMARYRHDPP